MSHVIAVAQRKGGVGKTTLAVCVAAEFRRWGRNVALIDADPQRSACHWAELGNLQFPAYELTLGNQPVIKWVNDLIAISKDYEYLVVDTAPSDRALVAPIVASSLVLVPCTPSGLDLEATAQTLDIVNAVRSQRQKYHPLLMIVPNRVDARTLGGPTAGRGVKRVWRDREPAHRIPVRLCAGLFGGAICCRNAGRAGSPTRYSTALHAHRKAARQRTAAAKSVVLCPALRTLPTRLREPTVQCRT